MISNAVRTEPREAGGLDLDLTFGIGFVGMFLASRDLLGLSIEALLCCSFCFGI